MKTKTNAWREFIGRQVRLIVDDPPSTFPRPRDGIVKEVSETHLFLEINNKNVPFLLTTIRRIDLKDD